MFYDSMYPLFTKFTKINTPSCIFTFKLIREILVEHIYLTLFVILFAQCGIYCYIILIIWQKVNSSSSNLYDNMSHFYINIWKYMCVIVYLFLWYSEIVLVVHIYITLIVRFFVECYRYFYMDMVIRRHIFVEMTIYWTIPFEDTHHMTILWNICYLMNNFQFYCLLIIYSYNFMLYYFQNLCERCSLFAWNYI